MPIVTPPIPEKMIDLMEDLARNVFKENPENIYEFAALHFENLLKQRDGSLTKGYEKFQSIIKQDKLKGKPNNVQKSFNSQTKSIKQQIQQLDENVKDNSEELKKSNIDDIQINGKAILTEVRKPKKLNAITNRNKIKSRVSATTSTAPGTPLQRKTIPNIDQHNDGERNTRIPKKQSKDMRSRKLSSKKPSKDLIVIKEESSSDVASIESPPNKSNENHEPEITDNKKESKTTKMNVKNLTEDAAAVIIQQNFRNFMKRNDKSENQELIKSNSNDNNITGGKPEEVIGIETLHSNNESSGKTDDLNKNEGTSNNEKPLSDEVMEQTIEDNGSIRNKNELIGNTEDHSNDVPLLDHDQSQLNNTENDIIKKTEGTLLHEPEKYIEITQISAAPIVTVSSNLEPNISSMDSVIDDIDDFHITPEQIEKLITPTHDRLSSSSVVGVHETDEITEVKIIENHPITNSPTKLTQETSSSQTPPKNTTDKDILNDTAQQFNEPLKEENIITEDNLIENQMPATGGESKSPKKELIMENQADKFDTKLNETKDKNIEHSNELTPTDDLIGEIHSIKYVHPDVDNYVELDQEITSRILQSTDEEPHEIIEIMETKTVHPIEHDNRNNSMEHSKEVIVLEEEISNSNPSNNHHGLETGKSLTVDEVKENTKHLNETSEIENSTLKNLEDNTLETPNDEEDVTITQIVKHSVDTNKGNLLELETSIGSNELNKNTSLNIIEDSLQEKSGDSQFPKTSDTTQPDTHTSNIRNTPETSVNTTYEETLLRNREDEEVIIYDIIETSELHDSGENSIQKQSINSQILKTPETSLSEINDECEQTQMKNEADTEEIISATKELHTERDIKEATKNINDEITISETNPGKVEETINEIIESKQLHKDNSEPNISNDEKNRSISDSSIDMLEYSNESDKISHEVETELVAQKQANNLEPTVPEVKTTIEYLSDTINTTQDPHGQQTPETDLKTFEILNELDKIDSKENLIAEPTTGSINSVETAEKERYAKAIESIEQLDTTVVTNKANSTDDLQIPVTSEHHSDKIVSESIIEVIDENKEFSQTDSIASNRAVELRNEELNLKTPPNKIVDELQGRPKDNKSDLILQVSATTAELQPTESETPVTENIDILKENNQLPDVTEKPKENESIPAVEQENYELEKTSDINPQILNKIPTAEHFVIHDNVNVTEKQHETLNNEPGTIIELESKSLKESKELHHEPKDQSNQSKEHHEADQQYREIEEQYHEEPFRYTEDHLNDIIKHHNEVENQHQQTEDEQNKTKEQQNQAKEHYHEEQQHRETEDQLNDIIKPHNEVENQHQQTENEQNKVKKQIQEQQHRETEDQLSEIKGQQNQKEENHNEVQNQHRQIEDQQNQTKEQQIQEQHHEAEEHQHNKTDEQPQQPQEEYHEINEELHEAKEQYHQLQEQHFETVEQQHETVEQHTQIKEQNQESIEEQQNENKEQENKINEQQNQTLQQHETDEHHYETTEQQHKTEEQHQQAQEQNTNEPLHEVEEQHLNIIEQQHEKHHETEKQHQQTQEQYHETKEQHPEEQLHGEEHRNETKEQRHEAEHRGETEEHRHESEKGTHRIQEPPHVGSVTPEIVKSVEKLMDSVHLENQIENKDKLETKPTEMNTFNEGHIQSIHKTDDTFNQDTTQPSPANLLPKINDVETDSELGKSLQNEDNEVNKADETIASPTSDKKHIIGETETIKNEKSPISLLNKLLTEDKNNQTTRHTALPVHDDDDDDDDATTSTDHKNPIINQHSDKEDIDSETKSINSNNLELGKHDDTEINEDNVTEKDPPKAKLEDNNFKESKYANKTIDVNEAATTIQKFYRNHLLRQAELQHDDNNEPMSLDSLETVKVTNTSPDIPRLTKDSTKPEEKDSTKKTNVELDPLGEPISGNDKYLDKSRKNLHILLTNEDNNVIHEEDNSSNLESPIQETQMLKIITSQNTIPKMHHDEHEQIVGTKSTDTKSSSNRHTTNDMENIENLDLDSYDKDSLEGMYYSLRKNELMVDRMQQLASEERTNAQENYKINKDKMDFPKFNIRECKSLDATTHDLPDNTTLDFCLDSDESNSSPVTPNIPNRKTIRKSLTTVSNTNLNDDDDDDDYDENLDKFPNYLNEELQYHRHQEQPHGNIYTTSLSESDSDYYVDPTTTKGTTNKHLIKDDFNISTAFDHITSSDSESTIVSAATKIQAGARGFLTRRRLRRSSAGASTLSTDKQASFGNEAINQSLDDLIEKQEQIHLDDAAIKIQRSYRQHRRKNKLNTSDRHSDLSEIDQKLISESESGKTEMKANKIPKMNLMSPIKESGNSDNGVSDDAHHVRMSVNYDELDTAAQRRMTLQRGDAVQRNSTPDEIDSNSATIKNPTVTNGNTDENHSDQQLGGNNSSSVIKTSVNKKPKSFQRDLGIRQKTMPVQIDTDFIRIVPKHLRKRVKSAENIKIKKK